MATEIIIRPYREEDLSEIERLGQQTVADGTVFPFQSLDGVKQYWFSGSIFVAVLGDKIVGSYVIKPVMADRMAHIVNAGYMVDEAVRGKQIGFRLAQHSIRQSAQRGFHGMQFNAVVSTNHGAIRLWKKLGFLQVGTIQDGFRRDDGFVDSTIWYRKISKADVDLDTSW